MSETFKVVWEAEDGYVGGSRPHHMTIYNDLTGDETDEELEEILFESVDEHFRQTVSYFIQNKEEAMEWLRQERDSLKDSE